MSYFWTFHDDRRLDVVVERSAWMDKRLAAYVVANVCGAMDWIPPLPVHLKLFTRQCHGLTGNIKLPKLGNAVCLASWSYNRRNGKVASYTIRVLVGPPPNTNYRAGHVLAGMLTSVTHELQHVRDYFSGVLCGRATSHGNQYEFNANRAEMAVLSLFVRNSRWRIQFDRMRRRMFRCARRTRPKPKESP
jgi:hypothetical protein